MTSTDDILDRLAQEGAGVPHSRGLAFAAPLGVAALFCAALLGIVLGAPLGALPNIGMAPYAMKLGFTLTVFATSALLAYRAGLPGAVLGRAATLTLAAVFGAVVILAIVEVATMGIDWSEGSWKGCVITQLILWPISLFASVRSMRRLAPTRPRLAGAFVALAAGALGASLYTLWCPETSALFLLTAYGAPLALFGAGGSVLGPRLLRW